MKQFFAFVRKEFYHVFRDKKVLLLLFGMPVAQIVLFGFALTNEIRNSRVAVYDYAGDAASRLLTARIDASKYFDAEVSAADAHEVDAAFRSGKVKLAVVLPLNFEADLLRTNRAVIQVIADASDPNTASTLTSYITNIVGDYQRELQRPSSMPFQVAIETRMIYNPELKGATNFVPGVMALVLLLVCVLMTSVSIVREKELGTMEILLVSPFNAVMVIVAKAVPYFLLSLVNLTVILLLSVTLLDMPVRGSLALLYGESALLILAALSLGLLISNSTHSQQSAMLISLMGMLLPTMIFTGFMFPLENMPWPLQWISNLVPSKWYYTIVKAVMIKGVGLGAVWRETLILASMTIVLLGLSILKFKPRLE